MKKLAITVLLALLAVVPTTAVAAQNDDEFGLQPTWQAPSHKQVRHKALDWLKSKKPDRKTLVEAEKIWARPSPQTGSALLNRLAATLALGDPAAHKLVKFCTGARSGVTIPKFDILKDENRSPLFRNNLRLLLGRWLARERLYDESLEQLSGLAPGDVVDPASLLFYKGVSYHWLLKKDEGIAAIESLLANRDELPRRYRSIAELIHADLSPLKVDSMDHIARRMGDIRRRLDLGRAGDRVIKVEDGVIESLDKLIKKIEKQRQQASASAAGGAPRSSSPAPDSEILGGSGPGHVQKKKLGKSGDWSDLPAKKRREVMQQIGKDFPPHYREIIEAYLKKRAREAKDSD